MFTLFIVQRSTAGQLQAARFSMNSDEVADESPTKSDEVEYQ